MHEYFQKVGLNPPTHPSIYPPTYPKTKKVNASFQSKEQLQNEREVLGLMAPWLRDDVISTINRNIVRSVPIFDKLIRGNPKGGAELLQRYVRIHPPTYPPTHLPTHHSLIDIMQAKIFRPDELITKEGEASDRIYILAKGRVEVTHPTTHPPIHPPTHLSKPIHPPTYPNRWSNGARSASPFSKQAPSLGKAVSSATHKPRPTR